MQTEHNNLQAFIAGDKAPFREFISDHQDLIYTYCFFSVNSEIVANRLFIDIFQRAAAVSLHYSDSIDEQSWIFSIAYQVVKEARENSFLTRLLNTMKRQHRTQVSNHPDLSPLEKRIALVFQTLSHRNRSILIFHDFFNFPELTISRITGIKAPSLINTLASARQKYVNADKKTPYE